MVSPLATRTQASRLRYEMRGTTRSCEPVTEREAVTESLTVWTLFMGRMRLMSPIRRIGPVLTFALRMTWNGQHPTVKRMQGDYPTGVKVSRQEWKTLQLRLQRDPTLQKYHILIKPLNAAASVS